MIARVGPMIRPGKVQGGLGGDALDEEGPTETGGTLGFLVTGANQDLGGMGIPGGSGSSGGIGSGGVMEGSGGAGRWRKVRHTVGGYDERKNHSMWGASATEPTRMSFTPIANQLAAVPAAMVGSSFLQMETGMDRRR